MTSVSGRPRPTSVHCILNMILPGSSFERDINGLAKESGLEAG